MSSYFTSGRVTISSTTLKKGDTLALGSGGSAIATTVNEKALLSVAKGASSFRTRLTGGSETVAGYASATTVYGGGIQSVSSGGSALATTVRSRGTLRLHFGGSATGVVQSSGGAIICEVRKNDNKSVLDGVNGESGGFWMSGGSAMNFTVYRGGSMSITGGTACYTKIFSGGIQKLLSSGRTSNALVCSGGVLELQATASAGAATLLDGGIVKIASGARATEMIHSSGGRMSLNVYASDGKTVVSGRNDFGEFYLSGGVASGVAVYASSFLTVSSGGMACDIRALGGGVTLNSGASASGVELFDRGSILVSDGATVRDLRLHSGGLVEAVIRAGGTAEIYGVDQDGGAFSLSGGVASGWRIFSGNSMQLSSGGVMGGGRVEFGGTLTVREGALFDSGMHIAGTLNVSGALDVQGHELVLELNRRAPTANALVTNIAKVANAALSVSVASAQQEGRYTLARGAKNFTGAVAVAGGGVVLTAGAAVIDGDRAYRLDLEKSVLYFNTMSNVLEIDARLTESAQWKYSEVFELDDAGSMTLWGDFSALTSGKVAIYNQDSGKKLISGSIKRGKLSLKNGLFSSGVSYRVDISGSKLSTDIAVTCNLVGDLFVEANQADDDRMPGAPQLCCDETGAARIQSEWVGFSDTCDYRELVLSDFGSYSISLENAVNPVKLSLYIYDPLKNKYKRLKSVSISPKVDSKSGELIKNSGTISGQKLDPGNTYYIGVEATKAKQGKNSAYDIAVAADELYNNIDNSDNQWQDAKRLGGIDELGGVAGEYVGFGDPYDYFRFSGDGGGDYAFMLDAELVKNAKMTLYRVDVSGGEERLKKLKSGTAFEYKNFAMCDYVLEVASADKGKGVKNSAYDIIVTTVF